MLVLGIESSCDETAVSIVEDGYKIIASEIASQIDEHKPYGGVVPEVASRAHHKNLPVLLRKIFPDPEKLDEIDLIAVTQKPGLLGALLIGVAGAKALVYSLNKPLVAVDHVEGHIYSAFMQAARDGVKIAEPMVTLVVSGGHTALFHVKSPLENKLIGKTKDDAAGEAFDKVAAMLNLEYPGGPSIQKAAENGNPKSVRFPRSMMHSANYDFSFSGLKTAVLYYLRGQDGKTHLPHTKSAATKRDSLSSEQGQNLKTCQGQDGKTHLPHTKSAAPKSDSQGSEQGQNLKTCQGQDGKTHLPHTKSAATKRDCLSSKKGQKLKTCQGQDKRQNLEIASVADIAASFQQAVADVLLHKLFKAASDFGVKTVAIAGGVAANSLLRSQGTAMAAKKNMRLVVPGLDLCTDNAAFIAGLAFHKFQAGQVADEYLDARPNTHIRLNKRK